MEFLTPKSARYMTPTNTHINNGGHRIFCVSAAGLEVGFLPPGRPRRTVKSNQLFRDEGVSDDGLPPTPGAHAPCGGPLQTPPPALEPLVGVAGALKCYAVAGVRIVGMY